MGEPANPFAAVAGGGGGNGGGGGGELITATSSGDASRAPLLTLEHELRQQGAAKARAGA